MLAPPRWQPSEISVDVWRYAVAEDVLDVLAQLIDVDAAVAVDARRPADLELPERLGWPGLVGYRLSSLDLVKILTAAAADSYEQAVLVAADAPDMPGLYLAKLLRALTSRPVAAAPALPATGAGNDEPGLLGLAVRLPAPDWLPAATLDQLSVSWLRRSAPTPASVAVTPGWHRLRGPADLAHLDPQLEGWEATRALLYSPSG